MSRARIENVVTRIAQSYLLEDAAIGAELITIESGVEFSDDGGTLQIGDTLLVPYLGRNVVEDVDELPESDSNQGTPGDPVDNTDPEGATGTPDTTTVDIVDEDIETQSGSGAHAELILGAALDTAFPKGTVVMVYPQTESKWILSVPVEPGFEEAVWARVPHTMQLTSLEEGSREGTYAEQIEIQADPYGDFVVTEMYGQPARLGNEALVDVPLPEIGPDGNVPEFSPTPDVTGGLGSLYVTWPAIANADPVTYSLHISTQAGFTPSAETLLGTTESTMAQIQVLPDGTKLQAGQIYYVMVVASDEDGEAEIPGNADGAEIRLATNADISADYAYLGEVSVNKLTGGVMSAVVALAGQVSVGARATSGSGAGVDINNAGITLFNSANKARTVLDAATGDAIFRGRGEFAGLTVFDGLSVRGSKNEFSRGSETIAQEGITPSQVGPSVISDWLATPLGFLVGYTGLFLKYSSGKWEVFDSDGTNHKLELYNVAGVWDSTLATYTEDANHNFVAATMFNGQPTFLARLSALGTAQYGVGVGAKSTDVNDYPRFSSASSTVKPTICSDTSFLYIADLQSTTNVRIYKYDPSTADTSLINNNFETDASSGNGGVFGERTRSNLNLCTNPSFEVSTSGWAPGGGMATIARVSGGTVNTYACEGVTDSVVLAGTMTSYFNGPIMTGVTAGVRYYFQWGIRHNPAYDTGGSLENVTASSVGVVRFYNSSNVQVGSDVSLGAIAMTNNVYQTRTGSAVAPSGATRARVFPGITWRYNGGSPPGMNTQVRIDAVSFGIASGYFDGSYADTSTIIYRWQGTKGLSVSEKWTIAAAVRTATPAGTTGWSGASALKATQDTAGQPLYIASDVLHRFAVSSTSNVYRLSPVKILVTGGAATTPSGTVEFAWLNSAGEEISKSSRAWSDTRTDRSTPMTIPAITGRPPAGTTAMEVRITLSDNVGASLWVDDVTMTQLHGLYDTPATEANLTVPTGTTSIDALYMGNGDFGAKRYILAVSTASGQKMYVYGAAGGAATPSEAFSLPPGSKGIGYDGTNFWSLADTTLYKHEVGTKNIDPTMTQYAGFTWKAVSPNVPAETALSALTPFTGAKRKRITITTADINNLGTTTDPNAVGIFVGQATLPTVPIYNQMWLQGTPPVDTTQLTISTLLTTGTTAPNPAALPAPFSAATPSWWHSSRADTVGPVWDFKGDGFFRLAVPFAKVRKTSIQSLPAGSETSVTWDTTEIMRGGFTLESNRSFVIPRDGWYTLIGNVQTPSRAANRTYVTFGFGNASNPIVDGSPAYSATDDAIMDITTSATGAVGASITMDKFLSAGDRVALRVLSTVAMPSSINFFNFSIKQILV